MKPNEFKLISNEFKFNFEAFRNHNFSEISKFENFRFRFRKHLRRQKIHQSGTRLKRRVKVRKKKRYVLFDKKARRRVPPKERFPLQQGLELELELQVELTVEIKLEPTLRAQLLLELEL